MSRTRIPIPFTLCLVLVAAAPLAAAEPNVLVSESGKVTVHPIQHASFVLETGDVRVAVDPAGGAESTDVLAGVDLVLVTDIHGDHFDPGTLNALAEEGAQIVAPAAVRQEMDAALQAATTALANGESATVGGVAIEAIPMYNLTESRMKFHPKGRGNGYVLELQGLHLYISGDTEDIPEMRALSGIDAAFVCMNLPYTMDVEAAANAVIEMQPRIVFPYHYRGQDGISDVDHFAELVHAAAPEIEVRQLDWYPEQ